MSNCTVSQGIYSPLRQIITDSESEEEVHNNRNEVHLGSVAAEDKLKTKTMKNGSSQFQNLSPNEDFDEGNGFVIVLDNHNDNVSILPIDESLLPMTTPRKFFFVLSIVFCIFTVSGFLWVLPCSELGLCSSYRLLNTRKLSWENPYHDVEFKGVISVVNSIPGQDKNIIFLFRGDMINPVHSEGTSSSNNGIIQIVGSSGKVGWFISQPRLPVDIDCTLLDVNKDKTNDCIVVGEEGLFTSFSSLTGTIYWHLHDHDDGNNVFGLIDFPLIVMDMDFDGVNDMLTSCTLYENHNTIILVSGYRGSIIGKPLIISDCTSISDMRIDVFRRVLFTCKNDTNFSKSLKVISLEEIYRGITNKSYLLKWKNSSIPHQHILYNQNKENVYTVNQRKLIIENHGQCPKACRVNVKLTDERDSKGNISWKYSAPSVYGMAPEILVFNNFNNDLLKNHMVGFVLKFWQWNNNTKKTEKYDHSSSQNSFNIFNDAVTQIYVKSKPRDIYLYKRNVLNAKKDKRMENVTLNHIIERVVLVIFNETDIHIVNASQTDIIQLCIKSKSGIICQPDVTYQENSLLISDLDSDYSQELITHHSTFLCNDTVLFEDSIYDDATKCDSEWKLRSTVRIVRLEAELPKLYEAASHH